MKTGLAKRLPLLVISILLIGSSGTALADTNTRPYLKSFGGDVMTGGWFSKGSSCATGSGTNYQNPNFTAAGFTTDDRNGGILTFAKSGGGIAQGGSSSQYGVFSLGEVDGRPTLLPTPPDINGFYSSGASSGGSTSVKAETFANSNALPFGGKFEGSVSQGNCIPDYYAKKPASAQNANNISNAVGLGSGDYKNSPPAGTAFRLTNGSGDHIIPAGMRITIYVEGNVYIDGNIKYDTASTVSSVPKFVLIAKGSIYIDKGATQLDGLYIAEPADTTPAVLSADDGVIWTCHDEIPGKLNFTYPAQCNLPLVVNGALIAKQILFLRVKGDISSPAANTAEDSLASTYLNCTTSPYGSCNVAEIVNFTPAMIMGGSFFNTSSSASSQGLPIDSLLSLPPVF
ncbi:hypothetical protein KW794_01790 [Candidatus Saccharibacteria bacterium]|nr:hypothetical protein [Candidatus Saccharibacteria bacterium]